MKSGMGPPRAMLLGVALILGLLFLFMTHDSSYITDSRLSYDAVVYAVNEKEFLGLMASREDLGLHPSDQYDNGTPANDSSSFFKNISLLVTSHGGQDKSSLNNVWVYGYEPGASPKNHWKFKGLGLDPRLVEELKVQNLRGMKTVGTRLFIANAHSSTSKVLVADRCSPKPMNVSIFSQDSLSHPYALTYFRGRLFTDSQNSGDIVYYTVHSDNPIEAKKAHKFANIRSPRGIAVDRQGRLWASSTKDGVYVFDALTADLIQMLKIDHPVGIALDFATNMMYVGSVKDNCVYQIAAENFKLVRILRVSKPYKMKHPAGISVVGDRVYVVGQKSENLYAWETATGRFMGAVITGLPKKPEQILALQC